MPTELVQMIAALLPMVDLGNLRLSCRELESKTFWHLTKTYFTEVKFMHSNYALQQLFEMSLSRMGQYVRTLGLGPPSDDQGRVEFHREPVTAKKRQEILNRMHEYAEENHAMRLSGDDATMLHLILRNLNGVTALTFINPCDEGPQCDTHRSYGQHYLSETLGEHYAKFRPVPLDATQSVARLFSITLQAAQTVQLNISSIDYGLEHLPNYYHDAATSDILELVAWDYPVSFPKIKPRHNPQHSAFGNLGILKMHLGCSNYSYDDCHRDRFVEIFTSFISQTSSLHTLSFTLVEDLSTPDLVARLLDSKMTSSIRSFSLLNIEANAQEIINALDKLPDSLQSLRLQILCLSGCTYISLVSWIRDAFIDLTAINVSNLECYCGECFFPTVYEGLGMTDFLNGQIRKLLGPDSSVVSDEE